jgi:hypothetical protein
MIRKSRRRWFAFWGDLGMKSVGFPVVTMQKRL